MAIHKLHIDEFDEVDYELIAIHTSLEDYRLAYFLNQKLPILLSKSKNEIQINIKEGITFFSRFIYENANTDCCWSLVQNKNDVFLIDSSEVALEKAKQGLKTTLQKLKTPFLQLELI